MSSNTREDRSFCRPDDSRQVRAGLLLGLFKCLSDPMFGLGKGLSAEVAGLDVPNQAERWMPDGTYLEGLARIDHLDDLGGIMLRAGMDQEFADMGLFGKAVIHSETIWAALCILRDTVPYIVPGVSVGLRVRRGRCRFTYVHPFGVGPEASLDVQYTIGLICNLLAQRTGTRSAHIRVSYPGARAHHTTFLSGVSQVSEGDIGTVEFDDHLLRTPLKHSRPDLSDLLLLAMAEAPEVPNASCEMSDLVTHLQYASLRTNQRPLAQTEVANLLDKPLRTLQDALKKEGSRFDRLRDGPRHAIAREALRQGREIDEVAQSIGFSHRQNFSTAFSKWEGCSPSEFRSRGGT